MIHPSYNATTIKYAHASVKINNLVVATAISDSRHGFYNSVGMHPTVHMNAGDRAHVINSDSRQNSYYPGGYLRFSGYLIHSD